MATRPFRTPASIAGEARTRDAVKGLLTEHGFSDIVDDRKGRGTATTQVITARLGDSDSLKMHVRLCWRRRGRNALENTYSAAQLRAKLIKDDWDQTLDFVVKNEVIAGNTHILFIQDSADGIVLAAMVPSDQIGAIWRRQREISSDLINRGETGRWRKNHAENGSSPTIWLQDDRLPATHAVADVLWQWPDVVNILALPTKGTPRQDSLDDLPADSALLGRDAGQRYVSLKSGYPRDTKVRATVIARAAGRCERCGEQRPYPGFLDVHHILGVGASDRPWSCVALCPNCHRDAHYAPDRDSINKGLMEYAKRFTARPSAAPGRFRRVRRHAAQADTGGGDVPQ